MQRIVFQVMDGAAVNLGKIKGIGKLFKDEIKPHKFIVHHCSCHRNELVKLIPYFHGCKPCSIVVLT